MGDNTSDKISHTIAWGLTIIFLVVVSVLVICGLIAFVNWIF